ncbi:MAG: hypothetical protein JST04_01935 [Bdellovibrionales bacterium]|nr:hypothetical protein [Bdellovibrionales bacterium]
MTNANACSKDGRDGFLPRNSRYIPVRKTVLDRHGNPLGGGITEQEFNGVIDAVEKTYSPIVAKMGGKLVTHRDWKDGTVNAYADRNDGNWNISFFGGLARHKETTIDGFLLVVCHELGHQIGGAPKIAGEDWASNEGQADYFATLKCARRVLAHQQNLRELPRLNAPDSVNRTCGGSFKNAQEAALCVRSSMGGLALGRLLADLGGERMPDFMTPDKSTVSRTDDAHPAAQCRLDTYYNGATCPVNYQENVSDVDPTVATCSQEKSDKLGFRPRCWYAPQQNNRTLRRANPRAPQRGKYY